MLEISNISIVKPGRIRISVERSSAIETSMSSIVRYAYNNNIYNEKYNRGDSLTDFERNSLIYLVKEYNKVSPQVLDIGCGIGQPYDKFLVQKGCLVTGVDISRKQIKEARKNLPYSKFFIADILKFKAETQYDIITLFYSLFHLDRQLHKVLLEKIYSWLKPYGKVLLTVREEDTPLKFKVDFCNEPMVWSNFDIKKFKQIVEEIGFKYTVLGNEKDYGSSESHIWMVLEK